MKSHQSKLLAGLGFAALLGLTAGCGTTDTLAHRIEQHHEVYAGLSTEEKNQIDQGIITVGFSPEMVLMALGKPERIVPGRGPGAEDWIYVNLYSPNGSSLEMATKVKLEYPVKQRPTNQQVGMGALEHYTFYGADTKRDGVPSPTYQLEPDLANEHIKAESAIKVHVKFTEGTVADIQIVSDGKG